MSPSNHKAVERGASELLSISSAAISERITQVKATLGRFLGGTRPPFGFRACESGAVVADDADQAAIGKAKRMRSGGKSLRYIAGEACAGRPQAQSGERAADAGEMNGPG